MPPFRTPHFSHTPALPHPLQPEDRTSPRSPDSVTSRRQPGLRRPLRGQTPLRGLGPRRSSLLSPWLQKRLHSLAKMSPIMSTGAGRGVPQQQVPLRGAPPRRGRGVRRGSGWDGAERARGGPGAAIGRSAAGPKAPRRVPSAESFVPSPVNPTPTRSSLGLNPPTPQIRHQTQTPPSLRLRARPRDHPSPEGRHLT